MFIHIMQNGQGKEGERPASSAAPADSKIRKALVLGDDSRQFLSVIRSLGRGGVQVHVAWHQPYTEALRSRYVFKAHLLPPYDEIDTAWKDALIALMRTERFDLVIPCTELETIALQRNRAEVEKHGRVYFLNEEAFEVLFDKIKTNELARSVGVRTPREVVVTDMGQAQGVLSQFSFPIVIKPRASCDPRTGELWQTVRKAYDEEEFKRLLRAMLETGPVSVQENFIGHGVGVELLLNRGEPLLAFQHARVHEPLQGGQSSYRKSVPLSPELLEASLKILRPLSYTGVAMVEFKVNTETGEWVFLEVNARFWGSLPLAVASGADFPLALFQLLVEGRTSFSQEYRVGIHCRNWLLDTQWQRANWSADKSDPALATRPIKKVLADALLNLLLFKERSDTFTLDDPRPGLAEIGKLAGQTFSLIRKVLRLSRVSAYRPMNAGERLLKEK